MRKNRRIKKLSLNKTTLRHLESPLYLRIAGAADGDAEVDTYGCWTCKPRSVCCVSQSACHNSVPKADIVE